MKTIIIAIIFFISPLLYSQHEWAQIYNGPGNAADVGNVVATDGSGNVYVAGSSTGSGSGNDYAIIKYNSAGVQQWLQRYNGPGNSDDLCVTIAVDAQNNIYISGGSYGSGSLYDYATIKYNSSGVEQWAARYNGPGNRVDIAAAIVVDASGNVYVTGRSSRGNFTYDLDYATIKYNSAGIEQWTARYSGPVSLNNTPTGIVIDASGNVYVTGGSEGGITTNNFDFATIKYNSAGIQQWVSRYGDPVNGIDQANSIALDNSGNVYVTGLSYTGITEKDDYVTIKYNNAGVQQWLKKYTGPNFGNDRAGAVKIDNQGNVYVTGYSEGPGTGDDYLTIKYSTNGDSLWVKRYNGPGNDHDRCNAMVLDSSGNIYLTGFSRTGFIGSTEDYVTIKYNPAGVQQWLHRYNGQGNGSDQAKSISLDASGNVYVTGYVSASTQDYATLKYSGNIGITQFSNEVPENFSLSQNYPNPFNPKTVISFQLAVNSLTAIKIYDILGREVETLVNEQLKPGTYEVDWNASGYTSGVYLYKLQTDSYSETKKMILIK